VFEIYDVLFDYIEAASDKLYSKRRRWKTAMYKALWQVRIKLQTYYDKISQEYDKIYVYAALLDSSKKIYVFNSRGFTDSDKRRYV